MDDVEKNNNRLEEYARVAITLAEVAYNQAFEDGAKYLTMCIELNQPIPMDLARNAARDKFMDNLQESLFKFAAGGTNEQEDK